MLSPVPTPLFVIAFVSALAALIFLRAAARVWRRGRWTSSLATAAIGLLCIASAALGATAAVGVLGYRALTFEEVAATVSTEPIGPQRFRATIRLPDRRLAMYDLAGDAFYVDAHILKWHPLVNLVGLHTAYELDRVAGRYDVVAQERGRPRTVYSLARPKPVDLFELARRWQLLGPLVDAEYGSATFVAVAQPAAFQVRVSTSGLLIRPIARSAP